MASPAPTGKGSRARKGKRQGEQAQLYGEEVGGTKSRAGSKARTKKKSQGAAAAAHRLAPPHAGDLQYAAQQKQAYTTNARAERDRAQTLTHQEQEKMMREVMRHMLFRQKALPDVPVPRNDLTKLVLANSKDTKKGSVGNAIIALAQESFCKVMGIEMRELRIAPVTKGKSKLAESETAGSKFYILRSLVPRNWKKKFVLDDSQSPIKHLLIILLMLIKCAGDKLAEEDMWQHLGELGVHPREEHFKLGRVEDEIKTLVQKKYLIQRKQNGSDGNTFTYEAGANSLDELEPKGGIDAYIEQLFTDTLVQSGAEPTQDMDPE